MIDYGSPRGSSGRYDEDRRAARRRPEPSGSSPLYYGLFLALGLVLGGMALWGILTLSGRLGEKPSLDPSAQLRETAPAPPLDSEEQEAVQLFERVKDSVVNVDVVLVSRGWGDQTIERQASGGSGFIWDESGRIVTNFHVIKSVAEERGGVEIRVVLADRSAYRAELIGISPDNDLAVVQITAPKGKLKPITVGTSHDLKVGQKAYAIGNPLGLSLTMTKGLISSLNRIIESPSGTKITRVIQTDAAINPGNSGGPLLDKAGRLIGVNTSIATTTANGGNIGIGFAIPVDTVNRVVTELVKTGRSLRPDFGVKLYDERRLRQARYERGVMIDRVLANGPAAKAGMQGVTYNARGVPVEPGDLIIAINGKPVNDTEDYERILRDLTVGSQAKVKFIRGTNEMEATLTVAGV